MGTTKKILLVGLTAVWATVGATLAFSESIHPENAGVSLWALILAGAAIVLMQVVPAAMLFFSFLVTTSLIIFKQKKLKEEMAAERGKILLPAYEPTVIGKRRRIGKR